MEIKGKKEMKDELFFKNKSYKEVHLYCKRDKFQYQYIVTHSRESGNLCHGDSCFRGNKFSGFYPVRCITPCIISSNKSR